MSRHCLRDTLMSGIVYRTHYNCTLFICRHTKIRQYFTAHNKIWLYHTCHLPNIYKKLVFASLYMYLYSKLKIQNVFKICISIAIIQQRMLHHPTTLYLKNLKNNHGRSLMRFPEYGYSLK